MTAEQQEAEIILNLNNHAARNYELLPVILEDGCDAWLEDSSGNRYLDLFSSYAVTNFGHKHPRLCNALVKQLGALSVSSRVFPNEQFAQFCHDVAEFCGMDRVLPAIDGAGAVDRAIKIVRKWHQKKRGSGGGSLIFSITKNFHGRSYGALSMSDDEHYKNGFGPFLKDFHVLGQRMIQDPAEVLLEGFLEGGLGSVVSAVFVEPIQGEGGVIVPRDGFLRRVRELCTEHEVLMVADEIQTGFGRTGYDLACQYEGVQPDIYLLGKALGGGLLPISAVVAKSEVMDVIGLGDDGSTFGGYPLGCAVAVEAIKVLREEGLSENAKKVGSYFLNELKSLKNCGVVEARGRGLMIGLELNSIDHAKNVQLELLKRDIVCGLSHHVLRFNPPLIITQEEIDWALPRIEMSLLRSRECDY